MQCPKYQSWSKPRNYDQIVAQWCGNQRRYADSQHRESYYEPSLIREPSSARANCGVVGDSDSRAADDTVSYRKERDIRRLTCQNPSDSNDNPTNDRQRSRTVFI